MARISAKEPGAPKYQNIDGERNQRCPAVMPTGLSFTVLGERHTETNQKKPDIQKSAEPHSFSPFLLFVSDNFDLITECLLDLGYSHFLSRLLFLTLPEEFTVVGGDLADETPT